MTLAAFAIMRVNSIGASLEDAEAFRISQPEPLHAAREALDQAGMAARNAFIFHDAAAAGRELDIVDAKKAEYLAALAQLDPQRKDDPAYARVRTGMTAMAQEPERPRRFRNEGRMETFGSFLVQECSPLRRRIVADIDVLLKSLQAHASAVIGLARVVNTFQLEAGARTARMRPAAPRLAAA